MLGPLLVEGTGGDFGVKVGRHGSKRIEIFELAAEVAEPDGEGDGNEAEINHGGVEHCAFFDEWACFAGVEPEGLENRGNAVMKVRAKAGHGDDVENGDNGHVEGIDDHFPSVVANFSRFGEVGLVGVESGISEIIADVSGEVEKVIDDKGEDGETAPNHEARGARGLDGGTVLVGLARGAILTSEGDGGPDVEDEHDDEADARDPNARSVEHVVEELRVVVERFLSEEYDKVTSEVTSEEQDESEACEGDDEFSSYG